MSIKSQEFYENGVRMILEMLYPSYDVRIESHCTVSGGTVEWPGNMRSGDVFLFTFTGASRDDSNVQYVYGGAEFFRAVPEGGEVEVSGNTYRGYVMSGDTSGKVYYAPVEETTGGVVYKYFAIGGAAPDVTNQAVGVFVREQDGFHEASGVGILYVGTPHAEYVTSVVPGVAYVKETKKVAYNRPGSNARRGKHA